MNRIFFYTLFSLSFLGIIYVYQNARFASGSFIKVVFCDVGQGDAIFIRTPKGLDILVDGGPKNGKVLKCLSNNMPFWDRTLELVFATHPDSDHIGGLLDVLRSYKVKSFNTVAKSKDTVIFQDLVEALEKNKIAYRHLTTGNQFKTSDGVVIQIKWPDANFSSSDSNDYSLVHLVHYKDFKLLLAGDAGYPILEKINLPAKIQIFKLPHHGSKTGLSDTSFQISNFELAVISAGRNNRYHHPHPTVLNLLKKYNVLYKRTDLEGEISIVSNGTEWKLQN